jgi:hypothetical protein
MTDTLTPSMEVVAVPGAISGSAIIDDVCDRIAEKLARDCNLRPLDCYSGYSASVSVTLQLHDVYPVETSAVVEIGTVDAAQPSTRIAMNVPVLAADSLEARAGIEPPSLERPIDGAGAPAEAQVPQRRQYISRIRGAKR